MEEDSPNASSSSSSTLSPTERRQRDRKSEALRNDTTYSSNVLFHAAMVTHRELGNENAARIHKMLMDDPNCMDDYFKPKPKQQKLSPLQASGFLLHHRLTVDTYKSMKKVSDSCGASWLPSYDSVWKYKKEYTRPSPDDCSINEVEALISLEALTVHTFERIFDIPTVAAAISKAKEESETGNVKIICKQKVGTDR